MMRRWLGIAVFLSVTTLVAAQTPQGSEPFQPNPDYMLTSKQGPYMIYVASFRGDQAGPIAQDLVTELRRTHKLPAYLLRRLDEDAAAERDRIRAEQTQRFGEGYKYGRKVKVLEDWAVLVGNYSTMDRAKEDLDRIKQTPKPRNLPIFSQLQEWTNPLAEKGKDRSKPAEKMQDTKIETFRRAFVTRNPLAPKADVARADDQPVLRQLNAHERYSLLNCKAPYTLVVMEFRAPVQVESDTPSVFDQKAFAGSKSPYAPDKNYLEHAVILASRLTEDLRDNGKGYEAYLLHTRSSTLVTVGGFTGPKDPELQKAKQALAGMKVGGIQLLRQPYPCQVPKM